MSIMDRRSTIGGGLALTTAAILGRPAAAATDLVIGGIGSLSGGATDWGVATQRGVQLAIDALGGELKVGSQTYTPRLVMYDDVYSGQGGATAATRLVNADGAKFILGPIGTPAILGALAVTTPAKVLVMTDGFSPRILTPQSLYNYRISITTQEFAPPMVRWLKQAQPNARRVAVIGPSDATGQQIIPIVEKAYRDEGFEIAFSEKYERGSVSDFSPLLTRMIVARVDVLELNSNAPAESGLLLKQARQMGFRGTVIQMGGPSIEENMAVAGPLAEGFVTFDFLDSESPRGKAFVDAYRAKYSGTISTWAPVMFNGAQLMFEAMRRAGSLEVDAVKAALDGLDGYETIFGPARWGGQAAYGINHQLMINFNILQVRNGRVARVATVSAQ
jgi:branched-chain amino acid transport system substrate-binding protein